MSRKKEIIPDLFLYGSKLQVADPYLVQVPVIICVKKWYFMFEI